MENIKKLFSYRTRREKGERIPLYNTQIDNLCIEGVYQNQLKNDFPIEYFLSLSELEKQVDFIQKEMLPLEDFEQLLFSLLKCFNFSLKGNFINQRLSYFLLNDIFFNERCDKEKSFKLLLYFTQNSESFISNFELKNNHIIYKDCKIDIISYSNNYFNMLCEHKNIIEDGIEFSYKQLFLIKEIAKELFEQLINRAKINLEGLIFCFQDFYTLYYKNRYDFFKRLDSSLNSYIISSWDSEEEDISLYYGDTTIKEIENNKEKVLKRNVKRSDKIYGEYFVDLFVLYFSNTIEKEKIEIQTDKLIYFKTILQYHPFRRLNVG